VRRKIGRTLALAALTLATHAARAGHESPFYPSFYPQEIRIETLDAASAAAGWPQARVHAYVGDDLFGASAPADAIAVTSLKSYVVLTFDAADGRYAAGSGDVRSRCAAADRILRMLSRNAAGFVFHPYPVTPYHADYLEHADLAMRARLRFDKPAAGADSITDLRIRARGSLAEMLVPATLKADSREWDATLEELGVDELAGTDARGVLRAAASPWLKQGWFQAHLLYAAHFVAGNTGLWAEHAYRRLLSGGYRNAIERVNLERSLVTMLGVGCERVVAGYALRREYFNSEYSNGVENIAVDSLSGMRSAIFARTVKLKDFPWNGWLRLGIAAPPRAAWNPIGGFNDAFGRFLWDAVTDPALLPEPYGGSWIANRASIATDGALAQVPIPDDALLPEERTGILRAVGPGKFAQQRLRYSVVTSAFHDGTAMGVADVVYPYVVAFRMGAKRPGNSARAGPALERSAAPTREWLAGFKVIGVETQTRDYGGDLQFSYRVPVIDVYLNHRSSDAWEAAAVAPPWSTLPWELIVLMEEAADRGIAAFSESEAQLRGIPWLDLVRDEAAGKRLSALVDEFRTQAFRPGALRDLVSADEARERWSALARFFAQHGHFLVTNGPYRLASWSAGGVTLEVFRDANYPLGVGSFDDYAVPLRAYVTATRDRGDRIEIEADLEHVVTAQRSYAIERAPLSTGTSAKEDELRVECRYIIVAPGGEVVGAGTATSTKDARFIIDLKRLGRARRYTVAVAVLVGRNTMNPEIKLVEHRVGSASQALEKSVRRSDKAPASR